jgi:hypothetical protein
MKELMMRTLKNAKSTINVIFWILLIVLILTALNSFSILRIELLLQTIGLILLLFAGKAFIDAVLVGVAALIHNLKDED